MVVAVSAASAGVVPVVAVVPAPTLAQEMALFAVESSAAFAVVAAVKVESVVAPSEEWF